MKSVAHVFWNSLHIVDLRYPFRHLAVHAAVVDLLEGFALDEVAPYLAN